MKGQPDNAELAQLEEIASLARKRARRATDKFRAAHEERLDAERCAGAAELRLTEWHRANPEPQETIFEDLGNG